jgi:hypothetical protein
MDVQFTEKTYKKSLSRDYELLLKLVKKGYELIIFRNMYGERIMDIAERGTFGYDKFTETCKKCDLTFIKR